MTPTLHFRVIHEKNYLLSMAMSFFCLMPLAQTWHVRAEFYGLHSRFITVSLKCSNQVAPGQALNREPQRAP